jgi:hypothetical protein
MTIRHVIDYYMDGHGMIAFCKVCSAEGDRLMEECPGKFLDPVKPIYFQGMTEEEFDTKYQKALDAAKPKAINSVIENSAE